MLRRLLFAALVFLSLGCFVMPAAAEPFAPVLEAPKNIEPGGTAQMSIAMLKSVKVPDRSTVKVPAYPGAKIIQTQGLRSMGINGKQVKCINYIKLLSKDDAASVEAFYQKHLSGYQFENKFGGMIRLFWKGAKEIDPMDIGKMCQTPNILITDTGDLYKDLMPDAKTVIEITYP